MAKVDLQSAYRSVGIHPSQYKLTGLAWTFDSEADPTVLVDTRLPFGARKSPFIFHRITQSVKRMLIKRGITCYVYLDDFLVTGDTFGECLHAYNVLIALLRNLGFNINWKKVCDPTTSLTYLGVQIDTVRGTLSLPEQKAVSLRRDIVHFIQRKRVTRRQLESLVGKLQWASCVIPWGRSHTRYIYDVIATIRDPRHKHIVDSALRDDLQWWLKWLVVGNHTRLIWDDRPVYHVYTDACTEGAGVFCPEGDWAYARWEMDLPHIHPHHINVKEMAAVCIAASRWCQKWENKRVVIHTDSQVVKAVINGGVSHNRMCMFLLKELCFLALKYNFSIIAEYIPGELNVISDSISRLHQENYIDKFLHIINQLYKAYGVSPPYYQFEYHMTNACLIYLFGRSCSSPPAITPGH